MSATAIWDTAVASGGWRSIQGEYQPGADLGWLTKIVIGVGLVELRAFGGWINDIGEDVATATDLPGARQLFVALILLEAGCGFIFFYIWSRVHMPKLFLLAETESAHQARLRDEEARLREELVEARLEAARGRALAEAIKEVRVIG